MEKLKKRLYLVPVISYLNLSQPYNLEKDASSCKKDADQFQVQNGTERVISFFSTTLWLVERTCCVAQNKVVDGKILSTLSFQQFLLCIDGVFL